MMRLLLFFLLSSCSAFAGSNDTLENEIPVDEDSSTTDEDEVRADLYKNNSVNEIFESAVDAYLEEDWDRCIEDFNRALHGFRTFKRMVTNCRHKCREQAAGGSPMFPENIEDLHFYERKVRETLCLMTCNQDYQEIAGYKALKRLDPETERSFVEYRPYEYLHICYFKKNRNQDAASAVFTFLVKNPEHVASTESLKYYLSLPEVDPENVKNLEAPAYMPMYFKGMIAYEDEDYKEAIGLFESSLKAYMQAEEECRLYCEGPFDQGWNPEFTSSVANHFAYCLKCKRSCSFSLNNVNGDYRPDMLQSHYNYLQFAYYKIGSLKAACAAVESYLLFSPMDETMLHNKEYYKAQPKVRDEYFAAREEALAYVKRQTYERKLLGFVSEEFQAIDKRLKEFARKNSETSEPLAHSPRNSSASQTSMPNDTLDMQEERKEVEQVYGKERAKIRIDATPIAEGKELGGRERYVADSFLNETGCRILMKLASTGAVEGDGYTEHRSPHTKYERFEGVTIGRLALMVYFGQLEPAGLELLLDSTEAVRDHVERYFKLDQQLYFTYSHLVCRTAIPDAPVNRDDLSHEIHADNCILVEPNCLRESPAYVWRDYSAILYLNDDFEGGEFFFARAAKNHDAQATVLPRCGRMVGFSAGGENLHGVRAVREGRRCALALWFTLDETHVEFERSLARMILERVRLMGPIHRIDLFIPLKYDEVLVAIFEDDEILKSLLERDW